MNSLKEGLGPVLSSRTECEWGFIIFMSVVSLGGEIMAILLFICFLSVLFFFLFCLSIVCLPLAAHLSLSLICVLSLV